MGNVLVIGSGGQLAKAYKELLPDALFVGRDTLDLQHPMQVRGVLSSLAPSAVINTAAYTQVDKAETDEAVARAVNAESPLEMARYCAAQDIPFIHFSTDYVFNGEGKTPWKETDATAPLNAYGRSKLAGEEAIAQSGAKHLLFRTSWVYDAFGKNFVNTILRLAGEREELKVIDDQFGAPTYAPHLAEGALAALEAAQAMEQFPSGIYHLCNAGETTWFRFAKRITSHAKQAGFPVKVKTIVPIPATDYPLPAHRPYNSRLDCTKARSILGVTMPAWEEGLAACMEKKRESA